MRRLLPDASAHSLVIATGLGAASSSCSYASVALARSIFRKGADFTSAMAFQFASTNLVVELGIIMTLLLGWQFTLAEFVGGPLMIGLLALLFRRFLTQQLVDQAREQADKGLVGSMEGHAEMDMSVHRSGSVWQRLRSPEGFTATANYFVMDWAAIWRDIVGGLLIAGALAAWVPESFWKRLFFEHHSTLAKFWGPIIGPLVAMVSFVGSIGNVSLYRVALIAACLATSLAISAAPVAAQSTRPEGRCGTVTPSSTLNLVCNPLTSLLESRRVWDAGYARLVRLYGLDPKGMSARGRTEWRKLTMKAGKTLEVGEEICSPRRKALRARLARGDQKVLALLCPMLLNTLDYYRIQFIDVSERRPPNADETKALSTIRRGLKHYQPLLAAALGAVPAL
jgi:uncharacterized membrane protein YraQ (UPF0718 family)